MIRIRMLATAALLLGITAGAAAQELFEHVPAVSPGATAPAPVITPAVPATRTAPAVAATSKIPPQPAVASPSPARATPAPVASKSPSTASATTHEAIKPQDAWDGLFAAQAVTILAKGNKHDYATFAAAILDAARQLPDDPPVQAFFCTKAYEFGSAGPEGYSTASDAMDLMGRQPKYKAAADEKILTLYDLIWKSAYGERRRVAAAAYVERVEDAADTRLKAGQPDAALQILRTGMSASEFLSGDMKAAFQMHLKEALHKSDLAKRAAELKAAVELGVSRPTFAQQLVDLLLVEMDAPADAAAYANMTGDKALAQRVAQAGKKPSELGEGELLDLANWYQKKLETADDYAQYQTFPHALALLRQYLDVHDAEDVVRLKAKLTLEQMQKSYDRAAAAVAPRQVVDLIALIDPARHTVAGTWKISNGHLLGTVTESYASMLIPYQPPAEYDLRIDFRRVEGNDAIVLAAQQNGKRFAWMFAAYNNTICALETADGGKPKNSPAIYQPTGGVIRNGTEHTIVLKVRSTGIAVTLDGASIGQHDGDGSDLGAVRAHWNPISPLGLILHGKEYDISRLELTAVTGTGKKWDQPAAPAAPATARPARGQRPPP